MFIKSGKSVTRLVECYEHSKINKNNKQTICLKSHFTSICQIKLNNNLLFKHPNNTDFIRSILIFKRMKDFKSYSVLSSYLTDPSFHV